MSTVNLRIDRLGGVRGALEKLGAYLLFAGRLLLASPRAVLRPGLVVAQIYNAGALSLALIMFCGLFVGMVLGLQGADLLQRFGAEEALGPAAALGMLKQLGPVVAALLFAGRAGTALTSEIGLMAATDQLSAMEMMAVDPVRRVCVPRFLGALIALPLLTAIFITIGLYGSQLVGVQLLGIDAGQFWSQMRNAVELDDIAEGMVKSVFFALAIASLAVFEGFHAQPTAEGVGRATTRTVVNSSIAVLLLNYVLTAFYIH
jgi:phospholipid/cholesterol/gamma-HCH transport system permease protein